MRARVPVFAPTSLSKRPVQLASIKYSLTPHTCIMYVRACLCAPVLSINSSLYTYNVPHKYHTRLQAVGSEYYFLLYGTHGKDRGYVFQQQFPWTFHI